MSRQAGYESTTGRAKGDIESFSSLHEVANARLLESITQRDKWMLLAIRNDRSCHNDFRLPDPSATLKQDLLNPT